MGLSPGAPKRGMPTGSEAFLELPIALGYGPATGPTLKTALCHIRTLVGRRINTVLPALIGLRAFDLVSSRVWWEAATNTWRAPGFNWPSGFWPCVKSCLVGGSDKYMACSRLLSWVAFFCVLWWGALDRLWLRAARFGRVCSTTGYITSGRRGPSPQALTLFGGVGFIARRLRRPKKGNADGVRGIFGTAYRVGLRPCDRTHLKHGLVPYSYVGGT